MKKLLYLVLIVFLVQNCTSNVSDVPYDVIDGYMWVQKAERRNDSTQWKLVWQDEFDKQALDTTHWEQIGLYSTERLLNALDDRKDKNAWRKITNHWSSYASATNPEVLQFSEGNILLRAVFNPDTTQFDTRPYHTGDIWSIRKFAFQYGKLEARAKLDPAYGAWPAIWLISEKKIYPDHHNGEMDIMERLNHDSFVYQTIHSPWNLEVKAQKPNPKRFTTAPIDTGGYNIFGLEWYPTKIKFLLNGEVTLEYDKIPAAGTLQWPFDQPFFIILSQQLEGWPGKVTNPEELPIDMTIDWIRLYQ